MPNVYYLIRFAFATIGRSINFHCFFISDHFKVIPKWCRHSAVIWILNSLGYFTVFYDEGITAKLKFITVIINRLHLLDCIMIPFSAEIMSSNEEVPGSRFKLAMRSIGGRFQSADRAHATCLKPLRIWDSIFPTTQ